MIRIVMVLFALVLLVLFLTPAGCMQTTSETRQAFGVMVIEFKRARSEAEAGKGVAAPADIVSEFNRRPQNRFRAFLSDSGLMIEDPVTKLGVIFTVDANQHWHCKVVSPDSVKNYCEASPEGVR